MSKHILIIDDDPDDRYITEAVVRENNLQVPFSFSDFHSFDPATLDGTPQPSLILISYSANPAKTIKLIRQLKSNPEHLHIPVVVLSESANPDEVKACYRLGVSSFIIKPSRNDIISKKITTFFDYWLKVVEL
jgi:CheY-like chemotaxis protein